MTTTWLALRLLHLLGMALTVGAAAVKATLLVETSFDAAFAAIYLRVARPVTRLILLGMALAVLSGIGWIALGRPFTPALLVKVVLVAALVGVGAVIDKVVEPRFARLAGDARTAASAEAARIGRQYLAAELAATAPIFAIAALGALL